MKLYTIGFTEKTAEYFFGLLRANGVQLLVDIRLRPEGQLSGFAKKADLPYFLSALAGSEYIHLPILAPEEDILKEFRNSKDAARFEERFGRLMEQRAVPSSLDRSMFVEKVCCLLCSEALPEHCHRRIVAERISKSWGDVEIIHLT